MESFVQTWFPVLSSVLTVAAMFLVYWVRNTVKAETNEALGAMQEHIDEHAERLARLEALQKSLPTREDVHDLSLKVAEMGGDLKAMAERLNGLSDEMRATRASVQRVNDYLLNEKT